MGEVILTENGRHNTLTLEIAGTYTKLDQLSYESMGKQGGGNPPTDQPMGNTLTGAFTLNTDEVFKNFPIPDDYAGSGGITLFPVWTNDGDTDDSGKAVKAQITYACTAALEVVSGTDGTLTEEDTYPSATGGQLVLMGTGMNIPHAALSGKLCVHIKLMFVTPTAAALTCEPRLVGICRQYLAYQIIQP